MTCPALSARPYAQTHLIARFDVVPKLAPEATEIIPCFLMDRQDLMMRLRTRALGKAE
jgi:hypothetical protein